MIEKGLRKQVYSALSEVIRINHAEMDLEKRLNLILSLLADIMKMSWAGYYSLEPEGNNFILETSSNSRQEEFSKLDLGAECFEELIAKKEPLLVPQDTPCGSVFELSKEKGSLLAVPVIYKRNVHGAIICLDDRRTAWSEEEKDFLKLISQEIAGTIGNEAVNLSSSKIIAELTALFEVEKVLGTTLDLRNLLESVAQIITKVMDAEGCAVRLDHPWAGGANGGLVIYGKVPVNCLEQTSAQRSPKEAELFCDMATRKIESSNGCPYLLTEAGIALTVIAPLSIKGKVLGKLYVHGRRGGRLRANRFNIDDVRLLSTMGSMVAKSLENAFARGDIEALARQNEVMIRELSALYKISGDLMTTVSEDAIGQIIIKAITGERGLSFNNAAIFLIEEPEKLLTERWRSNENGTRNPLRIGLNEDGSLVKAVRQRDVINIDRLQWDPLVYRIWPEHQPEAVSYSVVPLIAKDKVIGVIVVEKSSAQDSTEIPNVRSLKMLANHAGLALENARLYSFLDRTNRELVEARELLTEAEKLAAMGEMASTLAHEIRNPLVSVGGLARRALKGAGNKGTEKRYLEVIVDEVGRLEKTLKELLDFVQEPDEDYAERDLNVIIEECLELMQREFKEGKIVLHKHLKPLPPVYCDARQIKHALFNILLNARQAMPEGGSVWISSAEQRERERHYAVCIVKDSGGGIPESILHNIFNPFFTTKKSGFGLGLALSYRIITRHQGKIDVENELGKGVAFSIRLPLDYAGKKSQNTDKKVP